MEFDLDYAKGVIRAEAEAINSVVKIVDAAFGRAAEMIYNCHGSVILSGIGKAGIIGRKISATLASTGTPSHFLHPAEAVHGDLGRLRKNDIIIVLSFGGETDEVIRLINLVKQQDIKMIAITSSDDSTLSRHSDVTLCIGKLSEACPLGVAPSVSTTCMLAIGDAIAFTVMKARNFSVEDYVRFHPGGLLGAKLMTVEQSMMFKPGEKLPIVDIDETIMELLEKTVDVKRHGAVMVVDKKRKLTGIITDADLRRLISKQGKNAFAVRVRDVMTSRCKKIRRDALAAEATAIFHKYRIDELPVVDAQDKPVGLIDVQDVLTIKVVG
ncbi:MAG: KpsF/GutQ family sugar-phosphate isomerase [Planctomycetota bacterium]|jgi:arabinose-5-phosphate isomerase